MTRLAELLELTADGVAAVARSGDIEEQSAASFLLSKLKAKDHKALISFLKREKTLDAIRPHFEEHKKQNAATLARQIKNGARTLSIAALVSGVFILQSLAANESIHLEFSQTLTAPTPQAFSHEIENDDSEWLSAQINSLTDSRISISVSEWAETKRYLPAHVTSMPGFYSYDVAPYLKEIADCLSVESAVRELDLMKGAQIGATVGILENAIGYQIDHVKSAPCMLLTADAGLAKIRVDGYITPMIQHSELAHLIRSADVSNNRKTGKTKDRIEWVGGGYLVPFGANSAAKLRSISIQILLEDEVDGFPEKVGKDGDPQKLAEARTKSYFETRKIVRISTPLLKGSSRIARGFERGDQRHYFVPCKSCGQFQRLVFQGGGREGEAKYGLVWEVDGEGVLLTETVRYLCKFCGHPHRNSDKAWMLPRGEWRATARPNDPAHRSYHISGLYSPVGMFPWEACVADWIEAWDVAGNRVKDVGLLQEFYNNVLGKPFEVQGAKIRFASVSAHRRACYRLGEIPNAHATQYASSPVLMLTCQVDVHKRNLAVTVMGWTAGMRCYVVDYWRFETEKDDDDCAEPTSPVWSRLRALLEETTYTADDGKQYGIAATFIDAGYANATVTDFCSDYTTGVYPILGRDRAAKNAAIKEFSEFKTQAGTVGYKITVDHYKDRIAPVLRREWSEESGPQRPHHFNAPVDITDKQLKELTTEVRREKRDDKGAVYYEWYRPGNARNELWDLLNYGHAGVEVIAWRICVQHFDLDTVDWPRFWEYIESEKLYFSDPV